MCSPSGIFPPTVEPEYVTPAARFAFFVHAAFLPGPHDAQSAGCGGSFTSFASACPLPYFFVHAAFLPGVICAQLAGFGTGEPSTFFTAGTATGFAVGPTWPWLFGNPVACFTDTLNAPLIECGIWSSV